MLRSEFRRARGGARHAHSPAVKKRSFEIRDPRAPGRSTPTAAILLALALPGSGAAAALCDAGSAGSALALAASPAARTAVLTFDAAWSGDGAPEILDALRERGIHATFFLAGRFVVDHPEIARRIAAEGHEAGNHTYRHDHLVMIAASGRRETRPGLTPAELKDEMDRTAAAFESVTGRPLVRLWRAPYGDTNSEILEWGREAGYRHVGWSDGLDALDWVSDLASSLYQSPDAAAARLLGRLAARHGADGPAVILMHLGSTRPAASRFVADLPRLIDGARALGYRFIAASEALAEGRLP